MKKILLILFVACEIKTLSSSGKDSHVNRWLLSKKKLLVAIGKASHGH